MDLRYTYRFPSYCPVAFDGDETTGEGAVVNLSMTGWKVLSSQSVPKGTHLTLRVSLPHEDSPVEVDLAEVRWSDGRAFGLVILRMRLEERERLGRHVTEYALPTSDLS